jgi:hypothetical protein
MQLGDDTSVADSLISGKLLFATSVCSRVGFDSRASNMLRRCFFDGLLCGHAQNCGGFAALTPPHARMIVPAVSKTK